MRLASKHKAVLHIIAFVVAGRILVTECQYVAWLPQQMFNQLAAPAGHLFGPTAAQSEPLWSTTQRLWGSNNSNNSFSDGSNQQSMPPATAAAAAAAVPFDAQQFLTTCGRRVTDGLTQVTTACSYSNSSTVNCQHLAVQNLVPSNIQSFTPPSLTGNFTSPVGCGNSNVMLSVTTGDMLFHTPSVPVLAVIAREGRSSKTFLLGSGVAKVRQTDRQDLLYCTEWQQKKAPSHAHQRLLLDKYVPTVMHAQRHCANAGCGSSSSGCSTTSSSSGSMYRYIAMHPSSCLASLRSCLFQLQGKVEVGQASQVELCMAPEAATPLQLTQTAAYSIGITPGNVTWGVQSSVVLPAAYAAAGEVHMFSGDTAVSWQHE
jgi:hypothetical protein